MIIRALTGTGPQAADRGLLLHRGPFTVHIRSDLDGRDRVYPLLTHLVEPI